MKPILFALLALATSGCTIIYADRHFGTGGGDTVVLCHKGKNTMELPREAATAHLNHGDAYGSC